MLALTDEQGALLSHIEVPVVDPNDQAPSIAADPVTGRLLVAHARVGGGIDLVRLGCARY